MSIKKNILLTIIAYLTISFVCCTYEDGPALSFRSKETRLCGNWISSKVTVNGNELESEVSTRTIEFKEDGTYFDIKGDSLTGLFANQGSWSFTSSYDSLLIRVHDNFTGMTFETSWEILKLAYKEIRLKNKTNSNDTEWWLKRDK